jgi:hypothetical protein
MQRLNTVLLALLSHIRRFAYSLRRSVRSPPRQPTTAFNTNMLCNQDCNSVKTSQKHNPICSFGHFKKESAMASLEFSGSCHHRSSRAVIILMAVCSQRSRLRICAQALTSIFGMARGEWRVMRMRRVHPWTDVDLPTNTLAKWVKRSEHLGRCARRLGTSDCTMTLQVPFRDKNKLICNCAAILIFNFQ